MKEKHVCLECNESLTRLTKHIKTYHTSIYEYCFNHNLIPETYCIHCKKATIYNYSRYPLRGTECVCGISKKLNYSKAANRREDKLKNIIMPDGRSKKDHIQDKTREKISNTIKRKILEGTFTPNITNSWANSKIKLRVENCDYSFRSAWEAIFWLINPHLKYELIRVPYMHNNQQHTYIVDFVDTETKSLYEIKPDNNRDVEIVKIKEKAAIEWCSANGYKYFVVGNTYFKERIHLFLENNYTNDTKILNAANGFLRQIQKQYTQNRHPIVAKLLEVIQELK